MQGDERNNTALKSTYGSIQNNELHQAMQTGTVPSELTGENKESKTIYINILFNTNLYIIMQNFQSWWCETWYSMFYRQISLNIILK